MIMHPMQAKFEAEARAEGMDNVEARRWACEQMRLGLRGFDVPDFSMPVTPGWAFSVRLQDRLAELKERRPL